MSCDNLVERDEHQSLAKHCEVDVVDPVEPEGNYEEEDNLWEEGDEVDGEKEVPRRRSLLEQMVARSLNIDPQHPSQPPILGSPDLLPDSEEMVILK